MIVAVVFMLYKSDKKYIRFFSGWPGGNKHACCDLLLEGKLHDGSLPKASPCKLQYLICVPVLVLGASFLI